MENRKKFPNWKNSEKILNPALSEQILLDSSFPPSGRTTVCRECTEEGWIGWEVRQCSRPGSLCRLTSWQAWVRGRSSSPSISFHNRSQTPDKHPLPKCRSRFRLSVRHRVADDRPTIPRTWTRAQVQILNSRRFPSRKKSRLPRLIGHPWSRPKEHFEWTNFVRSREGWLHYQFVRPISS